MLDKIAIKLIQTHYRRNLRIMKILSLIFLALTFAACVLFAVGMDIVLTYNTERLPTPSVSREGGLAMFIVGVAALAVFFPSTLITIKIVEDMRDYHWAKSHPSDPFNDERGYKEESNKNE